MMSCQYCNENCRKAGRQRNGAQKLYCKACQKYQQATYHKRAYKAGINTQIRILLCESVGIRGISRILNIAIGTVLRRIKLIAANITRPLIAEARPCLEVDELWTYVSSKDNEYWLAYALDRSTRQVVDFIVGKRTKSTLKELIERLLKANPLVIRTDKLTIYQRIIPKSLHRAGSYCVNRIERKNLSIRTHLKRLSRRTICFSRDKEMLESCLRIYFWRDDK
jgi:insertion element IS1 protein InsB